MAEREFLVFPYKSSREGRKQLFLMKGLLQEISTGIVFYLNRPARPLKRTNSVTHTRVLKRDQNKRQI
jgi:hypothetical protein